MRIGFVCDVIPSPAITGAGQHLWCMATELAAQGHHVTYILAGRPETPATHGAAGRWLRAIEDAGVRVVRPQGGSSAPARPGRLARLRAVVAPRLEDYEGYYDVPLIRQQVAALCGRLGSEHDLLFGFGWGVAAALGSVRELPRLILPGDPTHLVVRTRLSSGGSPRALLQAALEAMRLRRVPQWMLSTLRRVDAVTWTAAQHAEWLRCHGIPCSYIPTPAPDEPWQRLPPREPPRIVHLGHLGGTAGWTGIRLLLDGALPQLEQALGRTGFELHFIGAKDITSRQERALRAHPSVRLRGHVEDLGPELRAADVYVVPSPHRVGMRTRLVTGLSYGCCVVAHEACRLGNPELQDGVNVLLAADGRGLGRRILEAVRDSALRGRMQAAARRIYEEVFAPSVVCARYLAEFEQLLARRVGALQGTDR